MGGERSASLPGRALLQEMTSDTHWIGGWVGLRAGLDTEARGKVFCLCRRSSCSYYSSLKPKLPLLLF